jgi:hypothetical protein
MLSLRVKFTVALVLVAFLGIGTVALVANRVTAREFTLFVRAGGDVRLARIAAEAADVYASSGSWSAVAERMREELSFHTPGQGGAPGRGMGMRGQGMASQERILIVDPQGRVVVDTEGELAGESMEGEVESVWAHCC